MDTPTLVSNPWPVGQKLQQWAEPTVAIAQFADYSNYHNELHAAVLAQSTNPEFAKDYGANSDIGSEKIFDLPNWGSAAASLIHERARILFQKVMGSEAVAVDLSWASIYNAGDHCLPHAHPRTTSSVLYMLDMGNPSDADHGRFCFADPRMKMCCREEPGYMSTPCAPNLEPGMMMIFPGQAVHFVSTYDGTQPRITLTWNFNIAALPGNPLPEGTRPPGKQKPRTDRAS